VDAPAEDAHAGAELMAFDADHCVAGLGGREARLE
jgi:hypothetical protein